MAMVEWQGKVRVVVGELTRGHRLALWRQVAEITADESADNVTIVRLINDAVLQRATRAVYVYQDDIWQRVDDDTTVDIVIDDAAYTLRLPITSATLDELPASLADEWANATAAANEYLLQQLFTSRKAANGAQPSATSSEPPSAAGPSSEQKNES